MCVGEFYATDYGTANLDLLAAFFERYPEYADKTFLSVKVNSTTLYSRSKWSIDAHGPLQGGLAEGKLSPDSS